MRRALVWVAILAVAFAGAFALRVWSTGSRASTLEVGDCFEEPHGETISDVRRTSCTEPHTGEVFVVGNYPAQEAYPRSTDIEAWVKANCVDRGFESYTGRVYQDGSGIAVGWFYPSEDSWPADTEITCYLGPEDGTPVSTSYRKA